MTNLSFSLGASVMPQLVVTQHTAVIVSLPVRTCCAMALHDFGTCQLITLQNWVPAAKVFCATIPGSPPQALLRQRSAKMCRRAVTARSGSCCCLNFASTSLVEGTAVPSRQPRSIGASAEHLAQSSGTVFLHAHDHDAITDSFADRTARACLLVDYLLTQYHALQAVCFDVDSTL